MSKNGGRTLVLVHKYFTEMEVNWSYMWVANEELYSNTTT